MSENLVKSSGWYIRERRMCTSSEEPVEGIPSSYGVFNAKDEEICIVQDLKTALLFAAAPELLEYTKKLSAMESNDDLRMEAQEFIKNVPTLKTWFKIKETMER
mgnify:CR=1 FL=1